MRIPLHRLNRQLVSRQPLGTPAKVVAWFGAMQAQDYLGSLWAFDLRTPGATETMIEAALGGGILNPAVVIYGRVVGTWRRTFSRQTVTIALRPFTAHSRTERELVAAAAARYGEFLGLEPRLR